MSFSFLFTIASILFSLFSLSSVLMECGRHSAIIAIGLGVLLLLLLGGLLLWGFRSARQTGNPDYLIAAVLILLVGIAALVLREQILSLVIDIVNPTGPGGLVPEIME